MQGTFNEMKRDLKQRMNMSNMNQKTKYANSLRTIAAIQENLQKKAGVNVVEGIESSVQSLTRE